MAELPSYYSDEELGIQNRGFLIEFYHIPTGKSVSFKAILKRLEDRFESTWNPENVYGRMDPIQTFQGTKRVIGLGWALVAADYQEAKINLQKAGLLFSMLYPSYSGDRNAGASAISAAPIFRLAFSNLIRDYASVSTTDSSQPATTAGANGKTFNQRIASIGGLRESDATAELGTAKTSGLVGTCGGFTYAPNLEVGFFDPPGQDEGKLFPKEVELSCDYTVIHTHPLGWDGSKEFRNPNFPYGQPTQEVDGKDGSVRESRSGGTDQHQTAKSNQILDANKSSILKGGK